MNTQIATMNTIAQEDSREPGWQRGFWSLIVTQFQGAFSDNALKQLVIFIILGMNLKPSMHNAVVPLVGALFSLPFILFSMYGGFLADRFSKRTVTIGVKVFEIAIMAFTLAALSFNIVWMQLASVCLMGVHSAIFGPSKYGLLPELVPNKKLSWGNGVLELGTFLAIILGTMLGGFLSDAFKDHQHYSGYILIGLAAVGLISSLAITKVPAADPAKKFRANPVGDLWAQMKIIGADRPLWLAVLGNIYFSFFAMLIMSNIVIYGDNVLHLTATKTSYLNAALAIGIGLGSLAAGYLSGDKIEYGLIPLGAIGMTIASAALALPNLSFAAVMTGLAALGFVSGFFIVPICAMMQRRPDPKTKGGVLAAANLLSFVGIFAASGIYYLLTAVGLSPAMIFLASAILTLGGTIYCLCLLPIALARLIIWFHRHPTGLEKSVGLTL